MSGLSEFSVGLKKLAETCNSFLLPGSSRKDCHPFNLDGNQVGLIRNDVWNHLLQYPETFVVLPDKDRGTKESLSMSPVFRTPAERSAAVAKVLEDLRGKDLFVTLRGWRDELFDVRQTMSDPPALAMERSATPLFGTVQYGVHINGYCYKGGQLMMWIARRSKTKPTYPDMFDNMCAGGLSSGLSKRECAIKECEEEASVPTAMFKQLKEAGYISYIYEDERGVLPEGEFVFDILLPEDFSPVNADGEVSHFELMSLDKIKELIIGNNFKPNSALVIVDFMIRHGIITSDNEQNYCYLIEMMHVPLQKYYSTGRQV